MGTFDTYEQLDIGEAIRLLVELLDVTVQEASAKTTQCHGAYVRLSWLRELYYAKVESRQWILAARAYLLHLVGCRLFANKSVTHIAVAFLEAFKDFDRSAGLAWGAGALIHMYENLSYACKHHGKHLAGYICLLQCWIYEHFPSIGNVVADEQYDERQPRAYRWKSAKALPVSTYRKRIERLTPSDVYWTPYGEHRAHREFEVISMYSGFLKWGPHLTRYLPERVVRQFGYVQQIPPLPSSDVPSVEDLENRWTHFLDYMVPTGDLVDYPGHCGAAYMGWFFHIFHPFMTSSRYEEAASQIPPVPQPSQISPVPQPAPSQTHSHGAATDPPTDGDEQRPVHAVHGCQRVAEGL